MSHQISIDNLSDSDYKEPCLSWIQRCKPGYQLCPAHCHHLRPINVLCDPPLIAENVHCPRSWRGLPMSGRLDREQIHHAADQHQATTHQAWCLAAEKVHPVMASAPGVGSPGTRGESLTISTTSNSYLETLNKNPIQRSTEIFKNSPLVHQVSLLFTSTYKKAVSELT